MFQGEFSNSMDDKGRVSIPAAFREVLRDHYGDERLVITRSPHNECLLAYPIREWKKLQNKISQMRPSPELRAFKRVLFSSAQQYSPDRQGRVLIPQGLREWASLDRCVQFSGFADTFEIWDKAKWAHQLELDIQLARNFELDL
ncbi:MAG: division/cell wall cluster transcriptional repressor MraZ [Zetaproteobacteria bacterium]|nr:MAG: division/cell wall cluster transcriptional repressor MraZ [Zetaproteobacteria bacterium]